MGVSDDSSAVQDPVVRGAIEEQVVDHTVRSIARALADCRAEASARVRLTSGECAGGPVLAEVNARVGDATVRVQVGGPCGRIAELTADRLAGQLRRVTGADTDRIWPDPYRPALAVVTDPRPIVRRKHCALLRGGPSVAVRTMDAMDYDAHLYVDAETGEDAAVYRAGPRGVRMGRQHRVDPPPALHALPLTMNPRPAPLFTEDEAADRLCRYGLPFVFFTDPTDRRGRLLYRRYDGDLGLVVPREAGVS
ncbi:sigma 54 modulation/S30EA ribosomal C-terminal domain-containing protein [Nocardia bovistercoris]|uniref:Sigma 54 modulation/S30EA ribosomal C-terminal domain-containing protein n=1 Tax=Nocardia bovistercoris TaxID=2785916 RepID=A0A931I5N3_9NOCA|nr:sigma 54 modulation/S30EA ribosomal C-terminal domain-containing protein [Nocardia bovistercoris]MBH0775317.1 sigma 54 modulation/S30EA ribosomal C-terminal domain-containing protein [Nocardia bovistercoris]